MYFRTLLNAIMPGTKVIVYNEEGNVIYAGEVTQMYGIKVATYSHWRVKHIDPCHNSKDGSYLSITLKTPKN